MGMWVDFTRILFLTYSLIYSFRFLDGVIQEFHVPLARRLATLSRVQKLEIYKNFTTCCVTSGAAIYLNKF